MKFAIIATCGKQYRFDENCTVVLDRLSGNVGDKLTFKENEVLLVGSKDEIKESKNATVEVEILEHFRGEKLKIFKKRRRKHYDKCTGFRHDHTKILVKKISA